MYHIIVIDIIAIMIPPEYSQVTILSEFAKVTSTEVQPNDSLSQSFPSAGKGTTMNCQIGSLGINLGDGMVSIWRTIISWEVFLVRRQT